jgi:hypothetical protein
MEDDQAGTGTADISALSADALWVDAYQGEVLGEALFGALCERQADPVRRRQLEVLTLLERSTKELAEPVLDRLALTRGDSAASEAAGRELAEGVVGLPWMEFLGAFAPVTAQFLAKYRRLAELAADDDERQVAETYVAHEIALMEFVTRSIAHEPGDPLQSILALPHVARAEAAST